MNRRFVATVLTVCSIILASSILLPNPSFAQGTNPNVLIENGSFEQDFLGWSSWICTDCSSIDVSTIHDGSKSYNVDTTTIDHGSSISQPLPSGIKDFVFRAYVYRTQGSNTLELLSDWSPDTGYANFITRVDFADGPTGTVVLEAWNTRTVTDISWPSDGWHELVILADWARARQTFLLDNVLIAAVQASTVFSPEHVVLGDVGGWNNGHHSRYHYDSVSLTSEHPCAVPFISQVDDDWYSHPLGGNDVGSSDCSTIGSSGCTLASATMVFNAYGADLTPPLLSDCMDKSACPFGWAVGASCSNSGASWAGRAAFSWNRLDQELNENHRPVVLGMCREGTCQLDHDNDPSTHAQTHWVVVVSGQGDNPRDYRIHDPAFRCGASLPLSTRSEDWEFTQMGLYDGTVECSSLLPLTPSCASRGADPQPVEFDPPLGTNTQMQPLMVDKPASPSSTISGTVWIFTRTEITMTLELAATSGAGNVTDMVIWSDTMPNTNWQPFAPFVWLPVSESVFARFRDDLGNVTDVYSSTINPAGPPSAGPQLFFPSIKWTIGAGPGE